MGDLELALLAYYRSHPLSSLTTQETDEYLYLEVKLVLETWEKTKRG
ncbi:unnamed protein product, partial [marine sediment metagenome]